VPEDTHRPGAGAVAPRDAVSDDVVEQVEVLAHERKVAPTGDAVAGDAVAGTPVAGTQGDVGQLSQVWPLDPARAGGASPVSACRDSLRQ